MYSYEPQETDTVYFVDFFFLDCTKFHYFKF